MTKLLFAIVALGATTTIEQSEVNGTWRSNNQSLEYQGSNKYSLARWNLAVQLMRPENRYQSRWPQSQGKQLSILRRTLR
jgi:hypothetical protein